MDNFKIEGVPRNQFESLEIIKRIKNIKNKIMTNPTKTILRLTTDGRVYRLDTGDVICTSIDVFLEYNYQQIKDELVRKLDDNEVEIMNLDIITHNIMNMIAVNNLTEEELQAYYNSIKSKENEIGFLKNIILHIADKVGKQEIEKSILEVLEKYEQYEREYKEYQSSKITF